MRAPFGSREAAGRVLAAAIALCMVVLAGCSSYVERSTLIKQALVEKDYVDALEKVEGIDQSSSALLYHYEKGLILHYQDEFAASNEAFEEAEILLEELYTKSVTRELVALAIKDDFSKYRGDPFEAVLVNYYKILNYLHLGDIEGALVECRRVNNKLQMIIDAGEESFENDPFLQYLTAMVYDAAGDANDTSVSYRVAVGGYDKLGQDTSLQAPWMLLCDAAENARLLGDAEAALHYSDGAHEECHRPQRGTGVVNLFLESGYVTHKYEQSIAFPIYEDDDEDDHEKFAATLAERRHAARRSGIKVSQIIKIAMPVLADDPVPFHEAVVRAIRTESAAVEEDTAATDAYETRTVLAEDLRVHARRAFAAKEGKILLRTIVRALAKAATQSKAGNKNEGLGVLVNVFNIATETADTRSWSTLPQRINMARLRLPQGTWDLDVTLLDASGNQLDTFRIQDVVVRSGEFEFINFRIY
jgi:hypothetical protein